MDKNYLDNLGEWVKRKEVPQKNKALVSFLTVRDDVKLALNAGYSGKTVWAHMTESKRIDFSYQTFLKFVNHQIRRPKSDQTTTLVAAASQAVPAPINTSAQANVSMNNLAAKKIQASTPLGFTFNPIPNKEELL